MSDALIARAFAVELTIPDNEAATAQATLVRLGIACARLERSDIWVFAVEPDAQAGLERTIRGLETVYNPNKHVLRALERAAPRPGEAWIGERHASAAPRGATTLAGRRLPGVYGLERYKGWRLWKSEGEIVSPHILASAIETLLCNPAFQVAKTFESEVTPP